MLLACSLALAWTGALQRAADGAWYDPTDFPAPTGIAGERYREASVWVDVAVANWYYDKDVAVYWTVSGSGVWTKAEAWYEYDLGDGYEQWGVDLNPFGTMTHLGAWETFTDYLGYAYDILETDLVFEYVVMVEMGGSTWWDNNGGANYTLTLHEPELHDQGDATILDTTTDLVWTSCPVNARTSTAVTTADCSGAAPASWGWSTAACDNLSHAGRTDWRLPTSAELAAWATLSTQVPDLYDLYAPNTLAINRAFWSSTTSSFGLRYADAVQLGPSATGVASASPKSSQLWVWCVAG